MKYMLIMNGTRAAFDEYMNWPKKDLEANVAFMHAFARKLDASGELVDTKGLGVPARAKRVRAGKNGVPITDGVFPESKEFLAGYWVVEVDSPERAYEIAAEASTAPGPGVGDEPFWIEVREVLGSYKDLK